VKPFGSETAETAPLSVNEERRLRRAKKGRETTTGCFHRRILAVQLPPCL